MSRILNQRVLVLNAGWLAIGFRPLKKVIEDMNSSRSPKKALKIEYGLTPSGEPDYDNITEMLPLGWDDWVTLLPRHFDEDVIRSARMEVRIPTVVIAPNYNKVPIKRFRATKRNIYERYGGKCAYTGRALSYKEATLDHVNPRSRGGGNTWQNLVLSDGPVNRKKADRTPQEAGMKLLYKPSEPSPVPMQVLIREALHPDWRPFMTENMKNTGE